MDFRCYPLNGKDLHLRAPWRKARQDRTVEEIPGKTRLTLAFGGLQEPRLL